MERRRIKITNLGFVDDVLLFSENVAEVEKMIKDIHRQTVKVTVGINVEKTNVTFNKVALVEDVKIYGKGLTDVDEARIWSK